MTTDIPKAEYALIGGSGTWGARFPEDLDLPDVEIVEVYGGFDTPHGRSAPFKLLHIGGKPVWRVAMHGVPYDESRRPTASPWVAARQVAWVLQEAGVRYALVEGSVGGIQNPDTGEPLPPWSVVIGDDVMMLWRPPDDKPFSASRKQVSRLRDPFCSGLRQSLYEEASRQDKFASVHDHGVHICTQWGRFETTAEIRAYAALGAHVVGHTLGHEAPLMRRIGVHLATLNIVSNYAEGHTAWTGDESNSMAEFYFECPHYVGPVMVAALQQVMASGPGECACDDYYLTGLNNFPVDGA